MLDDHYTYVFDSQYVRLLGGRYGLIVEPPKRAAPATGGDAAPENAGGAPTEVKFSLWHLHMLSMTTWTKTFTREPQRLKSSCARCWPRQSAILDPRQKRPPKAIAAKGDVAHSGVQEPSAGKPSAV